MALSAPLLVSAALAQPTPVRIGLPGRPFHAIGSADGRWVFVAMHPATDGTGGGLAVIRRSGDRVTLERTLPPPSPPQGLTAGAVFGVALTRDGRTLVLATRDLLRFYDVARLTSGTGDPLIGDLIPPEPRPNYFHIAITAHDNVLFVTNHNEDVVSVIDLAAARRGNFKSLTVAGRIHVGYGTSGIALSPDERYLYVTSQGAVERWGWPNTCRPLGSPNAAPNRPFGAIVAIDVAAATRDPDHAVLTVAAAGCDPVRVAVSPMGDRVYVTARSDSAVLAFDAKRLVVDSAGALVAQVRTHAGPVGLVVLDRGSRIAVANTIRNTGVKADDEAISIFDGALIGTPKNPLLGSVAAGGAYVDLELTSDQRLVLIPNFEAQSLTVLPIAALPTRR